MAVPAEEHAYRQAGKDQRLLPEYDAVCRVDETQLKNSFGDICRPARALETILDVPGFCG